MQIRSSGWTAAQNMLSTEELLLVPTSFHQTLPHCHYRYLQLPHIINIISHGLYTYHHHLSLNHDGHLGTTDDFTTSFLHFSLFSTALWDFGELQACLFPDVVFPPLPLSALSSSPFHCALQDGSGKTWWTRAIPLQSASLYDGQEVFLWSESPLDLRTDFFVGNMVFVWDV